MRILSVDLGTSNTVAVLSAHGRPPRVVEVDGSANMPSAVFATEDGTIMVGRDAERRARLDPTRFEPNPKRRIDEQTLLLGTDVIPVSEVLAAILRRVLDETTRQLGGELPDEVRLTHPAQWGPTRRNVLLSAARLAGMGGNLVLVPEPVAAAAHFASFPGKTLAPGQALAVYDLGAGTFDVAIVGATPNGGFTVVAEDGLPDLGGLDVDQALLVHVGREVSHKDPQRWQRVLRPESTPDRRTRRALQEDVKAAKEALSRHPQTEVPMPEPFEDVLVTRGELEALVRPSMLRSVELMSRVVRSAGLTPDRLAGIYLVGGSSRLPLVGSLIAEKLGVVPGSLDQPETAVALGAQHVASDGISAHTQGVEGQVAAGGTGPYQVGPGATGPYAPPPQQVASIPGYLGGGPGQSSGPGQSGGFPQSFPSSGPQQVQQRPAPTNFPTYSLAGNDTDDKAKAGGKKKPLVIGAIVAVVVLIAAGLVYFLTSSSTTTYTAGECKTPSAADDKGLTGCLRQLAGGIADTGDCKPGMGNGPAKPAESLGVTSTCSAPGRAGTQITYLQSDSADKLKAYTDQLLTFAGGDRTEAKWAGNALEGQYSSAAGRNAAVLVFTVTDRPLVGFIYQVPAEGQTPTPGELADYFEKSVQPGD